jgi:hypothetical protein
MIAGETGENNAWAEGTCRVERTYVVKLAFEDHDADAKRKTYLQ